MKVAIIGYGHVGTAMHQLFTNAYILDEPKQIGSYYELNKCDVAFICVPTNMKDDGSCDTSIVEEVISKCQTKLIVIRSTVEIGFTDRMIQKYHKHIVFQPEYYGETVAHPYAQLKNQKWLSFGGSKEDVDLAIQAYQTVITADVKINIASAKEVEMAKYMENAFYATKVTFCNEMYDICKKLNIDYNQVREIWLSDPRINRSHTFVYETNRGYGGACLPKDIASLQYQCKQNNIDSTLIDAVINKNKQYK